MDSASLPPPPPVRNGWDGSVTLTDIPGAARLAGVSRRTIYNWAAKGLIETRYTPSGKLRVVVASLWRDRIETARVTADPMEADA